MKKMKILSLIFVLGSTIFGCSYNDYYTEYKAEPKTPVGIKLVEGTDLIASIHSDTTYNLVEGVDATEIAYLSTNGSAMKIFIFEVDLGKADVDIKVATPNGLNTYGMQPMTEQAVYADGQGHKVWAGVNADFFNMGNGTPRGVLHKNGVVIKTNFDSGDRGFFAVTDKKKALVGDRTEYPQKSSELKLQEAVGGGAMLVRSGNVLPVDNITYEPRTCIGISSDSTKVYMFAADGRNFSYSNGMTLEQLAKCLKALGSHSGINLDGGGSTTFFIRDTPEFTDGRFKVRNWPTDNGGQERPVANGLVIISKK